LSTPRHLKVTNPLNRNNLKKRYSLNQSRLQLLSRKDARIFI